MSALLPANEHQRLQVVQRHAILDTPPEAAFDRITRLASHLLDVPIVLFTIVDRGRQWLKSSYGVDVEETSRDRSFGARAIFDEQANHRARSSVGSSFREQCVGEPVPD